MLSRPLILFLCRANTTTATTTPISLATTRAAALTLAGFDAHVIVDANSTTSPTPTPTITPQNCVARVHFPRASEMTRLGWTGLSNTTDGLRWERATLWAHDILRTRDGLSPPSSSLNNNVWFIDEGVWWREKDTVTNNGIQGLVTAYITDHADLIVLPPNAALAPQWRSADGVIPPAFLATCSSSPFMRLSYRTLAACAALARAHGRLISRDILFPSIIRMLSAGVYNVRPSLPTPALPLTPTPVSHPLITSPSASSSSAAAATATNLTTTTAPPTLTFPVRTIWLNSPWTNGIRTSMQSTLWTDEELSICVAPLFFPVLGNPSLPTAQNQMISISPPPPPSPPPLSTPRVAVAFFGLVKDFALVSASVEKHLLSPLRRAGFAVDIFCHTYALNAVTNSRNNEKGARIFPASLSSTLPLKGLSFSNPADIDAALPVSRFLRNGDAWPESPGLSALFYIRQLVSLDQVTRLWTHAEASTTTYDLIIYSRPDVLFFNDIDIARHLPLRPNTLYAPNFHTWVPGGTGSHGVGINDRFAFGRPEVMKVYGARLCHVDSFLARVDRPMLHAEAFLAALSVAQRWSVVDLAVRFGRVRAGGTLADSPLDIKLRFGPNTPAVTTTLGISGGGDSSSTDASSMLAAAARALGCSDVPVTIGNVPASAVPGRKRERSSA